MLTRIMRALIRYLVAFRNLGFYPTCNIVFYSVLSSFEANLSLETKKFGKIHWNTQRDKVVNHLYTPQIEICNPTSNVDIRTIIDLGANIGMETLRFSKMYPMARVIAVEVESRNFELLNKNTANIPQIKTLNAAIWSKKAQLKLEPGNELDGQDWRVKEVDSGENFDFIGMPLMEILHSFNIASVDILKVDIEGAERELFNEDCREWINLIKCLIIECPDAQSPLTTAFMYRNFDISGFKFNTYINGENLVLVRKDIDWMPRFIEIY